MEQTQNKQLSAGGRQLVLALAMCLFALAAAFADRMDWIWLVSLLLLAVGGVFTTLLLTVKSPATLMVATVISVTLLQTAGGFVLALPAIVILLSALLLSYAVRKRKEKTETLVMLSVSLGVGSLLVAALIYALDGGSLHPEDLMEAYHGFFKEMEALLAAEVRQMVENIDEQRLKIYAQMEITREMLLENYMNTVKSALDMAELCMPGALILSVQLIAYALISAFRITARLVHVDGLLPAPHWHLIPTQVSCIVYIAVSAIYILASFFLEADSAFMAVLMNLWLVLLPTMLLCGFRVLVARLAHPMYRARTSLMVFIFVFGFFFLQAVAVRLALFVLSFLGAQTISAMHMMEAEKNKKT